MKKSIEIKKELDAKAKEIENLQGEGKIAEAKALVPELQDLKDQYTVQAQIESAQVQSFLGSQVSALSPIMDKAEKRKMENRIFNKLVFGAISGQSLNDEEKEYLDRTHCVVKNTAGTPGQVGATPAKGGYLIPTEQFAQILEFRRQYTQLKSLCTVRPAGSRNGTQPTLGEEDGQLTAFDEINTIAQSDVDFGQLTYAIKTYGDIIPISNELLQDVDVDLIGTVGQRFARKSLNTENAQILAKIGLLTASDITDYGGIQTALNKSLDPAISAVSTILTNQSGFDYLDQLKDAQKRPLLTVSLADPTQMLFKGRRIVVLKDTLLASDTTTTSGTTYLPFIVGSVADYIHFFDRVGVEIAVSDQAGFTSNSTLVRAIERFDTVVADSAALKYLKLGVTA